MAALSDYLESGILNHIFRGSEFVKPTNISIALTSGVPFDFQNGTNIPEIQSQIVDNGVALETGYERQNLGPPEDSGNLKWNEIGISNTAYQLYNSGQTNHSGYFYPIYLNQDAAVENGTPAIVEFSNFPNETFYTNDPMTASGVEAESVNFPVYNGNGFIKNSVSIVFPPAQTEWGWISGVAILDSETIGDGNLLMYAKLANPRYVYAGDSIRFDSNSLEISLN